MRSAMTPRADHFIEKVETILMGNSKRALLLGASGLGVLSLVVGAFFVHSGAAAASPTAATGNSTPITYIANPPMRYLGASFSPKSAAGVQACIATYGLACYEPSDIRTAYNIPDSATGAGQTIVIIDAYGSPTIQSDLKTFDAAFGLPDPTLNIFYPTGKPPFDPKHKAEANWAGETTLDVEWAHAIAPAATIDLVIGSNPGGDVLNVAERYAIDHHLGNVMSMSFGAPENAIKGGGNNIQLQQAHANYVAAQAAGMTVFASAGDNGATDGTSGITANYPASDPLVTAVGGTNLFTNADGSYANETVWNDSNSALCPFGCAYGPFGATGGAPSATFAASSYQSALSGNSARTVSDVSYNASVYTGVLTYESFIPGQEGFYFTGGTSSGSPQWAAIIADADQAAGHSLGFLNPTLYAIGANPTEYAADFHDVTVGDNGFNSQGFPAGAGYDIPTGLGSPNVANLINTLAK